MTILLAGVVAGKEDVESSNLDEEHGSAEDMACRIRGNADGGDGMRGIVVDGFDLRKGAEVVLLGIYRLIGRI